MSTKKLEEKIRQNCEKQRAYRQGRSKQMTIEEREEQRRHIVERQRACQERRCGQMASEQKIQNVEIQRS